MSLEQRLNPAWRVMGVSSYSIPSGPGIYWQDARSQIWPRIQSSIQTVMKREHLLTNAGSMLPSIEQVSSPELSPPLTQHWAIAWRNLISPQKYNSSRVPISEFDLGIQPSEWGIIIFQLPFQSENHLRKETFLEFQFSPVGEVQWFYTLAYLT